MAQSLEIVDPRRTCHASVKGLHLSDFRSAPTNTGGKTTSARRNTNHGSRNWSILEHTLAGSLY